MRDDQPTKVLPVGKLPFEHLRSLLSHRAKPDPRLLLIAVAPDKASSVLTAIEAEGVPVAVIGEVRPSSEAITIVTSGAVDALTPPVRDEVARNRF